MSDHASAPAHPSLHPGTDLGPVTIRVSDAARSRLFYEEVLGFHGAERAGAPALGAGGPPLVVLNEVPGARPAPRASGLYHFAVLVPTRGALGKALRRLAEAGVAIGQADHLVSEALYLSDPDGNGIEIYRDRPRSEWTWRTCCAKGTPRPPRAGDFRRGRGSGTSTSRLRTWRRPSVSITTSWDSTSWHGGAARRFSAPAATTTTWG